MELFNESLTYRYITLERNIKSKSNSFYDSYLDLLEATIKYVLDENSIEYDASRTCGFIIREENIKDFFLRTLKVDLYTYNKLSDYIKKCNDHKHKREKWVSVESVINFLKVYFDAINYYIAFIKGISVKFDADYYASIYGETERLNNEFKEEVAKLKEELKESYESNKLSEQDLEKYKSLLSIKDIQILDLDEQNKILQGQIDILKDIKINSMEEKLNKALDMLVNLNDEIQENRVATNAVYRSITGKDIKTAIERIKEEK